MVSGAVLNHDAAVDRVVATLAGFDHDAAAPRYLSFHFLAEHVSCAHGYAMRALLSSDIVGRAVRRYCAHVLALDGDDATIRMACQAMTPCGLVVILPREVYASYVRVIDDGVLLYFTTAPDIVLFRLLLGETHITP